LHDIVGLATTLNRLGVLCVLPPLSTNATPVALWCDTLYCGVYCGQPGVTAQYARVVCFQRPMQPLEGIGANALTTGPTRSITAVTGRLWPLLNRTYSKRH